jgi:hypothetical protein
MWIWFMVATLQAADGTWYLRHDQPLRVKGFRGLDDAGKPSGYTRRRDRYVRAWLFPDGQVEHHEQWQDGDWVQRVRLDASGARHTQVSKTDGQPMAVEVYGTEVHTVDTSAWAPTVIPDTDWTAWLPASPQTQDGVLTASDDHGTWRLTTEQSTEVWTSEFAAQIEAGAGGTVVATATAWIAGKPAARLSLELPHPVHPAVAEIWALPLDGETLVLTYTSVPGKAPASLDTLAPGRAAASLLTPTR